MKKTDLEGVRQVVNHATVLSGLLDRGPLIEDCTLEALSPLMYLPCDITGGFTKELLGQFVKLYFVLFL